MHLAANNNHFQLIAPVWECNTSSQPHVGQRQGQGKSSKSWEQVQGRQRDPLNAPQGQDQQRGC